MPYEPITNFRDSTGTDLGKKLVTKDYLLSVYGSLLDNLAPGINPTPALWVWGANTNMQLTAFQSLLARNTPITTSAGGSNWKSVSVGSGFMAAIKTDGTLWTWGANTNGQLGVNNTTTRSTPVTTILGGTNWKSVSCYNSFATAIKTDGTLWTWGSNNVGQLGVNDNTNRSTPVTTLLGGTNWKSVISGWDFVLAIKTDGTLWTWGANGNYQLGTFTSNLGISTPVTTFLGGTDWKSASGGQLHTAAIKTDGTLWCWGSNLYGLMGTPNVEMFTGRTPVTTILGGTDWQSVSCGRDHIVAIKTDGTLWSWGRNFSGELGVNDRTDRSTPVTTLLGGTNWKFIDGGANYTGAIKTDGTLWTWGSSVNSKLGTNTTSRSIPVTVFLTGNNWKSISCGYANSAAIRSIDYI